MILEYETKFHLGMVNTETSGNVDASWLNSLWIVTVVHQVWLLKTMGPPPLIRD